MVARYPVPDGHPIAARKDSRTMLNTEQFSAEYLTGNSPLIRFLKRRTDSIDLAEQIASETWLRAWKFRAQFSGSGGSSFRSWVFGIGLNCLREHRRRQSAKFRHGIYVPEEMAANISGHFHDPAIHLDAAQFFTRLQPRVKTIAKMKFTLGYTDSEIAGSLGVPVGTVKVQMFRALGAFGLNRSRAA
jgi:RNA polymerase sigma factor (sigma-70 family)